MNDRWRYGTPPKDGDKYEMKFRVKNAGGQWTTALWGERAWWDGKTFVECNQFAGGTRALVPTPNRWRAVTVKTGQTP
jgi:hypothetical protein